MSFEGYYQCLCEKGHYSTEDCYVMPSNEFADWNCPICGSGLVWWNIVDTTNDCGMPVTLKEITDEKMCKCTDCGTEHISEHATYAIPKSRGHVKDGVKRGR